MRALLAMPLRTVGACTVTALALTVIAATVAGYAGLVAHALLVLSGTVVAFCGILVVTLSAGQLAGVLEANQKEGSAHADQ